MHLPSPSAGPLWLWRTYRIYILLLIFLIVVLVRLAVRWKRLGSTNQLHSSSPKKDIPSIDKIAQDSATAARKDIQPPAGPRRIRGVKKNTPTTTTATTPTTIQPHIFHLSLSGSTRTYAERVHRSLFDCGIATVLPPVLHDLSHSECDDFFVNCPPAPSSHPHATPFYLLLLPTYDISTDIDNFLSHLQETHHDFRIDTAPLAALAGYSVFGLGDKTGWPSEAQGFCSQAVEVDKWMARLTGGKRAFPIGMGDSRAGGMEALEEWSAGVHTVLADLKDGGGLGLGVSGSGDAMESEAEDEEEEEEEVEEEEQTRRSDMKSKRRPPARTSDLEDLQAPMPIDFTTAPRNPLPPPKAMVPSTSPTYAALTKQGYTIVGTHSGVKICRWTKSALRGRGSCYKYSFYGIQSHLCMEATPSLSCSNKCVFCWRHGTNPVSTTWKWTIDPPDMIFAGLKEGHYKKIKMLKGVPGVRSERFAEAMRIRHCALSLVGEPIFYPHINQLLAMLHREHISSFLVCNAQHPDQLAALGPVTQLYVSIDASNKESLKRIDRPLHRDFWERFLRCMDILREKRFTHRTVFRLTLVKGFNIEEEAEGYVDLVQRALPAFVEVKGVTYCGTSTAAGAGLSMQNVPFYEEVTAFVLALKSALQRRGLLYGIGAEHAHSCCILLADQSRFFRASEADGIERWHTLIDYPKFFECLESGQPFRPEDYVGQPTPEWALWGKGGFDPRDDRVDRKGRKIEVVDTTAPL